jgi:hypothetical protein
VAYEFTGFFARPAVPQPRTLPQGAVWRAIAKPFTGVGVRLPDSDDRLLLPPSETEALARQFGLDAAEFWVYLTYVCWGGDIDFVYGLGSRRGVTFGPVKDDTRDGVEAAYTGLMEQFGIPAAVAMQFEPFERGYWGKT